MNGVVLPKSRQKPRPVFVPWSVATGTSTCGVRTPPSALPYRSRPSTTGDVDATTQRRRRRRGVPVRTHVEVVERGLQEPVVRTGVDRLAAPDVERVAHEVEHLRRRRCRRRCRSKPDRHGVGVGVRRPGELPRAERRRVGLAGAEVGADARRLRPARPSPVRRGRRGSAPATAPVTAGSGVLRQRATRRHRGCAP